jgi:hypothetical protein
MIRAAVFVAVLVLTAAYLPPVCEPGVNMPLGDLPNMPIGVAGASDPNAACAALCEKNKDCTLWTYHKEGCSYDKESCSVKGGCCWLKSVEVAGKSPTVNNCTCTGYTRLPKTTYVPPSKAPKGSKNILYLLVDDMRPELEVYGQDPKFHHSPNIMKLAQSGTVFDNAYCQISVCSPSRMSFLTSRRPDHSRIYNFINHFRQADCGLTEGSVCFTQKPIKTIVIDNCEWGGEAPCGGSGQCCSLCSESGSGCKSWTYRHAKKQCDLFADPPTKTHRTSDAGCVSGVSGTLKTHASWVSMPEFFKQHGYLTVGTGKVFHTEEGGNQNKVRRSVY